MALSTYAGLRAAVADWLERSDLTTQIPDFIALTESRLNRELAFRTMTSDAGLTGVVSSRMVALPTGFREPVTLWISRAEGRVEKTYVLASTLDTSTVAGEPEFWTVDGANIAFERPCDQAYNFVLRMVGGLALSDSVTTNQVLTDYPDLYLFGALREAGLFLRDTDLLAMADGMFSAALVAARAKEGRDKGLAKLRTEVGGLTMQNRHSFDINTGR